MRRALIAICGVGLGAFLLAPGSASAAVTCMQAADVVTVDITAGSTQASLDVQSGAIRGFDGPIGGTDVCAAATATTTNTDTINVTDSTGGSTTLLISLQGGAFAPGQDAEPGGAAEIEITYAASGAADNDRIEVDGSDGADDFDFGEGAVTTFNANLNPAAETGSPDCDDIIATLTEAAVVRGRGGDDDLNATACDGVMTLDPLEGSLTMEGGNQNDFVRGGPGADIVNGGSADDNLNGGAGDDTVDGGLDDDKLDGGAGADGIEGGDETDRVLYDDRSTPLNVTVGNGAADDGGGEDQSGGSRDNVGATVEHVTGGSAGDSIAGSGVRNALNGGLGDDLLLGGGGNDDLEGEGGNDSLDGGGGNDDARGADGSDSARGSSGADALFGGSLADRLLGGAGADLLKGEAGKNDIMSGQAGNDKLNARDRKRDRKINCGKGKARKESAKIDRKDPRPKSC
jgi:Ca2+-binding RTX toxin-like protein